MGEKTFQDDYRASKIKSRIAWTIAIILALIWLILTLTPFFFMIMNSFRKQFDMLQQGVFHLPDPWYFENYVEVVTHGFFGYFLRSVIVVAISLVLMLVISAFAAYPLARMKFRFNALIYAGIVLPAMWQRTSLRQGLQRNVRSSFPTPAVWQDPPLSW